MKLSAMMVILSAAIFGGCANKSTVAIVPVSAPSVQEGRDPAQFAAYTDGLKQKAKAAGISQATIDSAFVNIHFIDHVVKSDRNQLEKKIALKDYLIRVLPDWKIEQGRTYYKRYQPQLMRVSQRYGVPGRYIVALWGMESSFGKLQGNEDVISALATLAFEGRREKFFTEQLIAALKIIEKNLAPRGKLRGSWAGAMGQSQFMPTSFLTYGADGDNDGKIDIWNNVDDVFASTANYLAMEGWVPGIDWGCEVKLPSGFNTDQTGLKDQQMRSSEFWRQQGVRLPDGGMLSFSNPRTWVIILDDAQNRAFLVTENFRTIMHWNRSYYFAISVGMMADGIRPVTLSSHVNQG